MRFGSLAEATQIIRGGMGAEWVNKKRGRVEAAEYKQKKARNKEKETFVKASIFPAIGVCS